MRPLDGSESDSHLFEIADVFELREDSDVQVGPGVKFPEAVVVKLKLKRKIVVRFHGDNLFHFASPYLKGSILKIACPLTARCQSFISSSWWISIQACSNFILAVLRVPSKIAPSGMEITASSSPHSTCTCGWRCFLLSK